MKENKKSIIQVIKFAGIGVFNTVLDYGLFYLFISLFHLDKSIAQPIATAIAMTNSYICNRYFTFEQKGKVKLDEMWKFIIVNIISCGATVLFLYIFDDLLHAYNWANTLLYAMNISYRLEGNMAIMFCKVLATPFSLAVNFIGNKLWVFGGANENNNNQSNSKDC